MQEYSNQRHDNIQLLLQAEQQASQLVQQTRQSKYRPICSVVELNDNILTFILL